MRAVVIVTLFLFTTACDDNRPPPPGRGADFDRGANPSHGGPGTARPGRPDPFTPPQERATLKKSGPEFAKVKRQVEAPDVERARDLSAELRELLGDPASCLGSEESRGEISIQVNVTVVESGRVTRSDAHGPVSDEALSCMQGRAAALQLRGPIPDSPRNVSTSVTVRWAAEE